MLNYKSPGAVVTFTAPAGGVVSGTPVMIGGILAIPLNTAAVGESFAGAVAGLFELPKTSAQAWAEGDDIFFDAVTGKADNLGTIGVLVGAATAVAANPSSTGMVRLDGINQNVRLNAAIVAATGSTNADAAQLGQGLSSVTGADGTKGVKLPLATAGRLVIVKNNGAAVLKLYPAAADGINALTVTTGALSMAANTSAILFAIDATTWFTVPLLPS